eukprot:13376499-Alexandrium_andersonii.AAC.3
MPARPGAIASAHHVHESAEKACLETARGRCRARRNVSCALYHEMPAASRAATSPNRSACRPESAPSARRCPTQCSAH